MRAISIAFVLLGHIDGTQLFGGYVTHLGLLGGLAHAGVRVFFVISGYLITRLLYEEIAATGRVDLRAFYLRRSFRIFPAFFLFLGVMELLALFGVIEAPARDVVRAGTYTTNFFPHRCWYVGHSWSLAVEEQFYLLWPLVVKVLGIRKSGMVAFAVVLVTPLVRIGWAKFLPDDIAMIDEAFPTIADAIATGCVLAWINHEGKTHPIYERVVVSGFVWLFLFVPVIVTLFEGHAKVHWLVGETMSNVAIAIVIDRAIMPVDTVANRVLNHPWLVWIGTLSYSLYLWQQPFLNRHGSSLLQTTPLNIVCAFAVAIASFYLIEKPFLRLRRRFEAKPATGAGSK